MLKKRDIMYVRFRFWLAFNCYKILHKLKFVK